MRRQFRRRDLARLVYDLDFGLERRASNSAHNAAHLSVIVREAAEDISVAMYTARDNSQ